MNFSLSAAPCNPCLLYTSLFPSALDSLKQFLSYELRIVFCAKVAWVFQYPDVYKRQPMNFVQFTMTLPFSNFLTTPQRMFSLMLRLSSCARLLKICLLYTSRCV